MTSFDARLRINGRNRLPLAVEIDLIGERMIITSDTGTVADWQIEMLDIVKLADGVHVRVDDEDIILNVNEPARFDSELSKRMA